MQASPKDLGITFSFILIIAGFMLANIIMPVKELSVSERRLLAGVPDFSIKKLFNGKLLAEFEQYSLDQFVLRDEFRGLKASARFYLFRQKDNNGVYLVDGGIYKMEYPLNEQAVYNAARKVNELYDLYLEGMNVHYAIIPAKNYYVARQKGYLDLDYDRMLEIMGPNLSRMTYIDLFGALSASDYYRTDIHWRQERIVDVAELLLAKMETPGASPGQYTQIELYPFYGSYHGQAALALAPDTLVYLTNSIIENANVYDYQHETYSKVYAPEMFGGMHAYDVYLAGAKPLISIENPACSNGRELILFRDSFGSSIAPLLLEGYSKVTLVDLRYISTSLLGNYLDFSQAQDVLFLYSTTVINNSWMLR